MEVKKEYLEWLASGDTGISSKTILSVLTGIPVDRIDVPHDMSDVGRCVRMLRRFPELRSRIGEMCNIPAWIPYVDAWKELERRYDACVEFNSLSAEEVKAKKRKKYFFDPNQTSWDVIQQIKYASMYLHGWRAQNSTSGFKKTPPETF